MNCQVNEIIYAKCADITSPQNRNCSITSTDVYEPSKITGSDRKWLEVTLYSRCAPHKDHKIWKLKIRSAIEYGSEFGEFGNFRFENQKMTSGSKIKTLSPVWFVFSKVRYNGELLPYVFHHEKGCDYVLHWSGLCYYFRLRPLPVAVTSGWFNIYKGSTSALKKHIRVCPHVGNGTQKYLKNLEINFNKEDLLHFVNSDELK